MLCTNLPFTLFRPCRKWKNLAKLSLQGNLTAYLHVCDTSPKYLPISFLLSPPWSVVNTTRHLADPSCLSNWYSWRYTTSVHRPTSLLRRYGRKWRGEAIVPKFSGQRKVVGNFKFGRCSVHFSRNIMTRLKSSKARYLDRGWKCWPFYGKWVQVNNLF